MNNIAVYTDELNEEPDEACQLARTIGLQNVCLRSVWGGNIGLATDENCKKVLAAVKKHGVKVVCLATDNGRVPADELGSPATVTALHRSIVLANYFRAKQIRVNIGLRTNRDTPINIQPKIRNWMNFVVQECRASALVPILEVDPECYYFEPGNLLVALQEAPGWRLLYDPALLMIRRNHDHVASYWALFRDHVAALDLHDYKPTAGFVPIGGGNCQWPLLVQECVGMSYGGWVFVEPGPSRRRGVAVAKPELCTIVLDNYGKFVKDGTAAVLAKAKNKRGRNG